MLLLRYYDDFFSCLVLSIVDKTRQTGSHGDDEQDGVGQKMMVEPLYAACQGYQIIDLDLLCNRGEVPGRTSRAGNLDLRSLLPPLDDALSLCVYCAGRRRSRHW